MAAIRKYKTVIAFVLLAVYAFIATPVSLWHQHSFADNPASSSGKKEQTIFSKSSGKITEASCQLCSHVYSGYDDKADLVIIVAAFIPTSKEAFYSKSFPSYLHFHFSNRGPPAFV